MPRSDRCESETRPQPWARRSVGKRARPCFHISGEFSEPHLVSRRTSPNDEVERPESGEEPDSQDFAQPAAEAIARHGRLPVTWHHHSEPRVTQLVAAPGNVQSWRAAAATSTLYRRNVRRARQAPAPRNPSDLNALRAWMAPALRGVCALSCGAGSGRHGPIGYSCGS